ncbi:hypothetical protein V1477_015094 [Vespula maculifrons]|uniref:Uncharacterized protein n=1 Tax=Vespula maculifrons TaxID=7453 RepID=A0ABD2BJB1_VESMC
MNLYEKSFFVFIWSFGNKQFNGNLTTRKCLFNNLCMYITLLCYNSLLLHAHNQNAYKFNIL